MNKSPLKGLVLSFFLLSPVMARASELFSSADAMAAKSWSFSVYGVTSESEPSIDVRDRAAVQVPVSGGAQTIFANSNTEVSFTQSYDAAVAQMTLRPGEGLHYRLKAGQVRDFEIEFASGSSTNSLRSESNGYLWGLGARWNLTQSTLVSAAVALDLSYTQIVSQLSRFHAGGVVVPSDIRFVQDEFQGALIASKRFGQFDPYAGVRIIWLRSELRDRTAHERVRGTSTGVAPMVGLKWEFLNGESLIVEGSFVDEELIAAGLNLRF